MKDNLTISKEMFAELVRWGFSGVSRTMDDLDRAGELVLRAKADVLERSTDVSQEELTAYVQQEADRLFDETIAEGKEKIKASEDRLADLVNQLRS